MAKKVMGTDGNLYKVKKPLYKKVWFWILVVFIAGAFGNALNGEEEPKAVTAESSANSEEPKPKKEEAKKEEPKKEDPKEFTIGDVVDLKGYEITVNTVEFSDGGDFSKPDDGNQFVIVNLTLTNNTEKKVSFNPFDFTFNVDGVSQSGGFNFISGIDTLSSGDLDPGATVTGNLIGQAGLDTKVKLRYEGNMFLKDKEIDIVLR